MDTRHNISTPSTHGPIPASEVGYNWVGRMGVIINTVLATVALWRIFVHHTSYRPYFSCSSKRLFHWLILVGRLVTLPQFIGILVAGEFNLAQYTLHTLNNVFQSAALAIVIKEWAFVISVLRQHSFTTAIDDSGGEGGGGYGGGGGGSDGSGGGGDRGNGNGNDSGSRNGGGGPNMPLKNSLYDSSGSGAYLARNHPTSHLKGNGTVRNSRNSKHGSRTTNDDDGWTQKQQMTCVRTIAIVYVAVFAVLCLAAFIAISSGPYNLLLPIDTGKFFQTSTDVVYISLETFWEATINVMFLAYGLSLRNSLLENSPPRSQGRVKKTLCRINVVVVVSACCSFLRLGLHVRSLFGKNARTDPQWITVLQYYILYDFIGRGLPAVILLILMRNPDTAYGRSRSTAGGHNSHHNRQYRRGDRNQHGSRSPWAASPQSEDQFPDWPSESSRSQYGTLSDGEGSQYSPTSPPGYNNNNNNNNNNNHVREASNQSMGSDLATVTVA